MDGYERSEAGPGKSEAVMLTGRKEARGHQATLDALNKTLNERLYVEVVTAKGVKVANSLARIIPRARGATEERKGFWPLWPNLP